ncbi:XamI family restriction endonuclease [uncultured Sphingomonas sp.]|uniref:XamI family restriction endonuclease n=1 Tax=uncultured Sphingomonas sp. TaxID=158754 RepID=UPI0025F34729|nr:XamI family restriction endonuclease [uncultured Sphingomonas sp.]
MRDLSKGISKSAAHLVVLRHMLAPPMSQDQFALLCPAYSKAAENTGRVIAIDAAKMLAAAIEGGRDKRLARWLNRGTTPAIHEVKELLRTVSPILAQQLVATLRRGRLSATQERAVIDLLTAKGWARQRSALIEKLDDVPVKYFMHKTRFATKNRPQEVDIACGLGKTVVLAMECKVTNDQTNSVKRVNDVLKKATAWQDHWGSFVKTAALLQGVLSFKDVERLLTSNVEVFWTHDLETFGNWLELNAIR